MIRSFMATQVFLLRHAETSNPTVFHGAESDIDLSPKGHRQAAVLAEVLAPRRPDVIVSSAMRRARQTAEPIARTCGLPLRVEPDLHERRVGSLSGTPFPAKDGIWPETVRRWSLGETSYAPDGAESFDAIQDRVLPVWNRLTHEFAGQRLVIVAHGIICKVLLLTLLPDFSPRTWNSLGPIRNVAVSELECTDSTWRAVVLNRQPERIVAEGLE
jgi:probable phosphoglycerate mutase